MLMRSGRLARSTQRVYGIVVVPLSRRAVRLDLSTAAGSRSASLATSTAMLYRVVATPSRDSSSVEVTVPAERSLAICAPMSAWPIIELASWLTSGRLAGKRSHGLAVDALGGNR